MRTAAVAWAHLDDREACAEAARAIALLTHADPLAAESCVLWSEAIRVAVVDGAISLDAGLDLLPEERRGTWAAWLADAMSPTRELVPGRRFTPNGYTVTAVLAAVAAITLTPAADSTHLAAALHTAVRIGNDTDTVAAIAGGLLGARWGASAVPADWRAAVHGWPGLTGEDLVALVR
jgi:ADP-ribosylglycohydrolase